MQLDKRGRLRFRHHGMRFEWIPTTNQIHVYRRFKDFGYSMDTEMGSSTIPTYLINDPVFQKKLLDMLAVATGTQKLWQKEYDVGVDKALRAGYKLGLNVAAAAEVPEEFNEDHPDPAEEAARAEYMCEEDR